MSSATADEEMFTIRQRMLFFLGALVFAFLGIVVLALVT
jgi:hypothetical protein